MGLNCGHTPSTTNPKLYGMRTEASYLTKITHHGWPTELDAAMD